MNRETVKTLGGLIIVAVIVAATFMYGNQQREAQQRRDQDLKKQQQTQQPKVDTGGQQSQPLQGGAQPPINATRTPETGGELAYLAGLTAIALLWRINRQSQKAVRQAALSH
ncbi:MAG TPA: hypothetical protein VNA68_02570 [Candidatus Dormibacteraeota bacterium]|nr:hypothetical protein [Candidatus Dormibacteraeota bacterium]